MKAIQSKPNTSQQVLDVIEQQPFNVDSKNEFEPQIALAQNGAILPLLPVVLETVDRAVLYARVSYDDRDTDGRNLQGQIEMGRERATEKGHRVVAELAEDDKGVSGYEIDLPKLNKIREMAHNGEFDVLIVRELDRLSRNLAKQLILEEELKRYGVRVEYVLAEYDDTPEGRLQKHIRATVAEYEREKIRERMIRGRQLKVKAGNVDVSGRPPYGYRVAEHNGKVTLEIVEDEARIIRLIFRWYVEGDETDIPLSMGKIARRLSEMRVPTATDTGRRPRAVTKKTGYGEWIRGVIARIISNETYIGIWHYGNTGLTVNVPAIISRELWEIAQERKEQNKADAKRNLKYEYLLARRAFCGCCGYKIAATTSRPQNGKLYLYYKCPSGSHDYIRKCTLPKFRADQVDGVVWAWVDSVFQDSAVLEQALSVAKTEWDEKVAPIRERLAIVDSLLADNKAQLTRLLDLYLVGDFPKEILTERKARLSTTIEALEREQTGLQAYLETQSLTEAQIQNIKFLYAQLAKGLSLAKKNFAARRQLIEKLNLQVTLTVEEGQKVVYVRCYLGNKRLPIVSDTINRAFGLI